MKEARIIFLIFVFGLLLAAPSRVTSQNNLIIISDADDQAELSMAIPHEVIMLSENITPRIIINNANHKDDLILVPISETLLSLLKRVDERIIISSANSNRLFEISFPKQLIGDDQPPKIWNLSATGSGVIKWNTDEFASSELHYGTQSLIYPNFLQNSLFSINHQYTIGNLIEGETYYFKVVNTDRSGNIYTSGENIFVATSWQNIFLPVVLK